MSCEFAHRDGSYVLGALSPAERREFEEHLETCPGCARAVRELAGLPGLLARVDVDVLETPAPEEPVPETLLPALVREVRRSRRRRVLVSSGLVAAAAATVAVASLAATGVLGGDGTPTAQPRPTTSVAVPVYHPMQTVAGAPVTGRIAFENVLWGTKLDLVCSYTAAPSRYQEEAATYALVVHTKDGRSQQVATWRGLPGRTMALPAATSARQAQIDSVEVRSAGQAILEFG
jgi:hypothetical protein